MSEQPNIEPVKQSPPGTAEAKAFFPALGRAVMEGRMYGPHHRMTAVAMERCFALLNTALSASPRIDIGLSEDILLVNGEPLDMKNGLVRACAQSFAARKLAGFSLKQGMTREELDRFVSFLGERQLVREADQNGQRALADLSLTHIALIRVVVTQVSEDEQVSVERQGKGPSGGRVLDTEQILAFLQERSPATDPNVLKSIAEVAEDPDRLAQLILDATAKRLSQQDAAAAESQSEAIDACLRRIFSCLMADPSARTQKGKAHLRKALAVVEQKLIEELKRSSQEGHEQAEQVVADAIGGMQEELQIDDLVGQYRKKKESAEDSESRIIRFMKRHGLEELDEIRLKDRLVAEGLPPEVWDRLVARSGLSKVDTEAAALTGLLIELTQSMDSKADDEAVVNTLRQVQSEIRAAMARTEQKIEELAGSGAEKRDAAQGQRRNYRELLREIVQELCQPLSVINCAIEMLSYTGVGELSGLQKEAINLATESSKRLRVLLDKLIEVSGVPTDLQPDQKKIGEIYERTPTSAASS